MDVEFEGSITATAIAEREVDHAFANRSNSTKLDLIGYTSTKHHRLCLGYAYATTSIHSLSRFCFDIDVQLVQY